jgi:diacylglycerol kinase
MKPQGFHQRLRHAWDGLRAAWRLGKSVRTHALATVAVFAMLVLTHAPASWWAIMALTIGLVVGTELLNTSIEALADHLHPERHDGIKLTKDVAAGAVLITSFSALVVGAAFLVDQVLPWLVTAFSP